MPEVSCDDVTVLTDTILSDDHEVSSTDARRHRRSNGLGGKRCSRETVPLPRVVSYDFGVGQRSQQQRYCQTSQDTAHNPERTPKPAVFEAVPYSLFLLKSWQRRPPLPLAFFNPHTS